MSDNRDTEAALPCHSVLCCITQCKVPRAVAYLGLVARPGRAVPLHLQLLQPLAPPAPVSVSVAAAPGQCVPALPYLEANHQLQLQLSLLALLDHLLTSADLFLVQTPAVHAVLRASPAHAVWLWRPGGVWMGCLRGSKERVAVK